MALAADSLSREGLVKHIFGEASYCVETPFVESDEGALQIFSSLSLSENIYFDIAVLLLIVLYFVWIIRYVTHRQRGDYTEERWLYGDQDYRGEWSMAIQWSDVFYSLAMLSILSITLFSLAVDWLTGYYPAIYPDLISEQLSEQLLIIESVGFQSVATAIAKYICATIVWLGMIFFAVSLLSKSEHLYSRIIRIRVQLLYQMLIYFIPILILFALNKDSVVLWYVVVAEVVVFLVLYFLRGLSLFITQKISILQWFLYLCTVEIIPVVVVWLIFVRRVSII